METTKITAGSAVVLSIIAIILNFTPDLINQDDVYVCIDTEIAMQCDRLSAVNQDGFRTRCYYEDEIENRTRYKNCKTGWIPYIKQEKKILDNNETGEICRVIRGNNLIKECVDNLNDTYLYMVRW